MTIREGIEGQMDELMRARDELKVRVHLGKADARDLYEALESKWHEVESRVQSIRDASAQSIHEITSATQLLLDEIRDGYQRVKSSIT